MSRVCLVGTGVPGFIPARVHNGPGLRTEHFARALVADGHELTVIYVDRAGDAVPDSAAFVARTFSAAVKIAARRSPWLRMCWAPPW